MIWDVTQYLIVETATPYLAAVDEAQRYRPLVKDDDYITHLYSRHIKRQAQKRAAEQRYRHRSES
jgi:hypothetical protein